MVYILDQETKPTPEELLHYGVKGMKWGVRRSREELGRDRGRKLESKVDLTKDEVDVLSSLGGSANPVRLGQMFGPNTLSKPNDVVAVDGRKSPKERWNELSPRQKDAIIIGGAVVVAVGVGYALSKKGSVMQEAQEAIGTIEDPRVAGYPDALKALWADYGTRNGVVTRNQLSEDGVSLPSGTILKRVSSAKETFIKDGGFYASYKEDDVQRYKAALPIFWKTWGDGSPEEGGYVVNLKSKAPIKAPAPKKLYDMTEDFLRRDGVIKDGASDFERSNQVMAFTHFWKADKHDRVQRFFSELKEQGFNAVTDLNDAMQLADNPLRVIDGSIFDIDSHDVLSPEAIRSAQETVKKLSHILGGDPVTYILGAEEKPSPEDVLHYGVKGMRWGVRRTDAQLGKARKKIYRKQRKNEPDEWFDKRSSKYTKKEIKEARARQKARAAVYQKAVDSSKRNPFDKKHLILTQELADARWDWFENDDIYVANRKTAGEKAVATILSGPIGAYLVSDMRTSTRVSRNVPVKIKSVRKYEYEDRDKVPEELRTKRR